MKNLAEQLQNLKKREQQAWETYSKSVTTQVNRLLEHMGEKKDFTMDDLHFINQENQDKNFNCAVLSNKTIAWNTVERYAWVKQSWSKWYKALRELSALEKEIKEAQALIK